ncbi:MAG: SCO family protein [Fimbriimonadaceae bacterium]|nr:SCO family protein [Fimbriimonadaceae bacterium]
MNRVTSTSVLFLAAAMASAQLYSAPPMTVPGQSRVPVDQAGTEVRVEQKLGAFVPKDVQLTDEQGRTVRLEEYLGSKPLIVSFIFYDCQSVCLDITRKLATTLGGFRRHYVGKDFNVLTVSIDPTETPVHARSAKLRTLDLYSHRGPDAEAGWHFTVGTEAEVRRLADAVGFKYTYDPASGNIVHPTGIIVLSPGGQVSKYYLSNEYAQQILLDSILLAQKGEVGVRDDRPFYLACIDINPMTGQRSLNVMNALRVLGIITIVSLATFIVMSSIKSRKLSRSTEGELL